MHLSYPPLEISTEVKIHSVMSHSSLDVLQLDTIPQKLTLLIVIRRGTTIKLPKVSARYRCILIPGFFNNHTDLSFTRFCTETYIVYHFMQYCAQRCQQFSEILFSWYLIKIQSRLKLKYEFLNYSTFHGVKRVYTWVHCVSRFLKHATTIYLYIHIRVCMYIR
jgi:hypothetical protein